MVIKVKKEIGNQSIEWFLGADNGYTCSASTVEYLRKHGYKTVYEVVDKQMNIPQKYWKDIKKKLGYAFLNAKVVKKGG